MLSCNLFIFTYSPCNYIDVENMGPRQIKLLNEGATVPMVSSVFGFHETSWNHAMSTNILRYLENRRIGALFPDRINDPLQDQWCFSIALGFQDWVFDIQTSPDSPIFFLLNREDMETQKTILLNFCDFLLSCLSFSHSNSIKTSRVCDAHSPAPKAARAVRGGGVSLRFSAGQQVSGLPQGRVGFVIHEAMCKSCSFPGFLQDTMVPQFGNVWDIKVTTKLLSWIQCI